MLTSELPAPEVACLPLNPMAMVAGSISDRGLQWLKFLPLSHKVVGGSIPAEVGRILRVN